MKIAITLFLSAAALAATAQTQWWNRHVELSEVMLEAQGHTATNLALIAGEGDLESLAIGNFLNVDAGSFSIRSKEGATYLGKELILEINGSYDSEADLYNWTTLIQVDNEAHFGIGSLVFHRFRGDDVKSESTETIEGNEGTVSSKEYKERKDKNGNPTGFVDSKGTFHYKKKRYDPDTKKYYYVDTFEQVNDDYEAGKGTAKWQFGKSAGTFGVSINQQNPNWNGNGDGVIEVGTSVVPEPFTATSLIVGAAVLAVRRRRSK